MKTYLEQYWDLITLWAGYCWAVVTHEMQNLINDPNDDRYIYDTTGSA